MASPNCPTVRWPSCQGELRLGAIGPAHLPALQALEARAHSHPWSPQNLASSVHSSHQCWGLWHQQTLLGHLIFSLACGEAEILLIVLAPEIRGQGLAKRLLQTLFSHLASTAQHCFLEVRASNTPAQHLYESLGFNPIGERPRYYPNGETAVVYGLDLSVTHV